MKYDHERAEQKNNEVIKIAEKALQNILKTRIANDNYPDIGKAATELVRELINVIPPEEPEIIFELVRFNPGGFGGGQSIKPGNLTINIGKLISAIAGGVVTIAGVTEMPWTAPFAAIVIWDSLWSGSKIDITEQDACVLWTFWISRDGNNCVQDIGLLKKVNAELEKHERSHINKTELMMSLDNLQKIKCIEHSNTDLRKWWLREWVKVKYS